MTSISSVNNSTALQLIKSTAQANAGGATRSVASQILGSVIDRLTNPN